MGWAERSGRLSGGGEGGNLTLQFGGTNEWEDMLAAGSLSCLKLYHAGEMGKVL